MSRRRLLVLGAAVAVIAVVIVGVVQAGGGSKGGDGPKLSLAQQRAELQGAPAELAALHAQASELLPTDSKTLTARIAALRAAGHGVVINKWAAWCGPCRLEFPVFQRVSVKLGKQVAFLGLDSNDNADDARSFLRQLPLSYPSYEDRSARIAQQLQAGKFFPTTVFIDPRGRRTVHQGPFNDDVSLEQAIRRYALS